MKKILETRQKKEKIWFIRLKHTLQTDCKFLHILRLGRLMIFWLFCGLYWPMPRWPAEDRFFS